MGGACCATEESQPQHFDVEDKKLNTEQSLDYIEAEETKPIADPSAIVPSTIAPSVSASVSDENNTTEEKPLITSQKSDLESKVKKAALASVLTVDDDSDTDTSGASTPVKDAELKALESFSREMGLDIMECAVTPTSEATDEDDMYDHLGQLIWRTKASAREAIHIDNTEDQLFPPLLKGSLEVNVKEVHLFVETVKVDILSPTDSGSRTSLGILHHATASQPTRYSLVLDDSLAKEHAAEAAKQHKKASGSKSLLKGSFMAKRTSESVGGTKHQGVWVECSFKQGTKTAMIKSDDTFDSRPSDYTTIDLREKFTFALDIDEITDEQFEIHDSALLSQASGLIKQGMAGFMSKSDSVSSTKSSPRGSTSGKMNSKVDGMIDLIIKKTHGALRSVKMLGLARLHIDELIERGLISRRGEWCDLMLPLYENTDEEFEQYLQKKSSKKKKGKVKRGETGFVLLTCRLAWSDVVMHEFNEQMKKSEVMEITKLVAEESGAVVKDKYYMLSHYKIKFKLVLLGMLMDPECLEEYDIKDTRRLITDLKKQGTHSDLYADMISNVCVTMEYLSMDVVTEEENIDAVKSVLKTLKKGDSGSPSSKKKKDDVILQRFLTKLHSSKSPDVVFIGEKFIFEIEPYIPETKHGMGDAMGIHPQWMFDHRYKLALHAPGSIQLNVKQVESDGTKTKLGTGLMIIKDIISQTAVETGQKMSHELLLPLPLYKPVSRDLLNRDTKQELMGYLLCRTKFGFDD